MNAANAERLLLDAVELLHDILAARADGSCSVGAGTLDADMLYAAVEVRDALPVLLDALGR